MNAFRRAFGVDAMNRAGDLAPKGDESSRITKVRQQVKGQSDSLSIWWKVALQANLQQRMWMKLGQLNHAEPFLPSKYERLYQPDKIAQFDRFFARGWATPLRRSHSAQHADGSENDTEGTALTRAINGRHSWPEQVDSQDLTTKSLAEIRELPKTFPVSLSSLIDYQDKRFPSHLQQGFLGGIDLSRGSIPEEYERYCAKSTAFVPPTERREAAAEFQERLHDCSLESDNVGGIRKVCLADVLLYCCGIKVYAHEFL